MAGILQSHTSACNTTPCQRVAGFCVQTHSLSRVVAVVVRAKVRVFFVHRRCVNKEVGRVGALYRILYTQTVGSGVEKL